jgi:LmbE family N-acetylglucosaminyl deacetylase
MAALGVVDHRLLGLADGSLDALALADGAGMIADLIADVCPDTVVTFGDDGVTGHPDHCAVARWVSSALAGERERPHVLAAALESGYCDRFDRLHRDLSVFMAPGYPRAVDRSDLQLHLELSGVWLDQKVAALRCQSTQTASVERAMGAATFREWVSVESFVDVTDRRPPSAVVRAGLAGSDGG